MSKRKALKTTRKDHFANWYQEVIEAAEMAEHSGVRGCMIICPWGFKIWEHIQKELDSQIKRTGHDNCYFPMFIPLDLIEKEAEHVEGFSKEMAVVTHHRLAEKKGQLVPVAPLETPLILRPTSETMITSAFRRWIKSYRDLPIKINQWANVVRWEMRPRLFLRTSEFLWQEGHTAHASSQEAKEEVQTILEMYRSLLEDFMSIPVFLGEKSEGERFPGAIATHTLEAMMQDGKALQVGTSHFLGQNFSKAEEILFSDKKGQLQWPYTTSWGVSTRLIGALIMVHADDNGLCLPPRMAPHQVVIVPIHWKESERSSVQKACRWLAESLKQKKYSEDHVRVFIDNKMEPATTRRWKWVKKGVPLIVEIGPRDLKENQISVFTRLDIESGSQSYSAKKFSENISETLSELQSKMFHKARAYRKDMNIESVSNFEEMKEHFKNKGGFLKAKWCGDENTEALFKQLSISIRCIPYNQSDTEGFCIVTGKPAKRDVIFAKAY